MKNNRSSFSILDFGIGVGRVAQYFCRVADPNKTSIYGCDVDSSAIAYVSSSFPQIQAYCSSYAPPLTYEDEKFDIIYSVSIFTHLPFHLQEPWLLELKRVLKPGGLLLPITIGPYGYRKGSHLQAVKFSLPELKKEGIMTSPYSSGTVVSPGTDSSYGATYHTPKYIRETWSKYFDIIDVQEGAIDDLNGLVIMKNLINKVSQYSLIMVIKA